MKFTDQFDALHEAAAKATGFDDFGPNDYVEPLTIALADIDKHCQFSDVGEQLWHGWFSQQLIGRLFAQEGFKSSPATPVVRPIFVVGMLRTGTTALLRLLSKDPLNQSLPLWLAHTPMPRPDRNTWASNPWYQQTEMGLEQLYLATSMAIKTMHPQHPAEADECHQAMAKALYSSQLALVANVLEYREWFANTDARYAYNFQRQLLGMIANGDSRRWVLKDPTHVWKLDTLFETFPDACVVFMHRDITTAMTSLASLVYEMRRKAEPGLGREQQGKEIVTFWGEGLNKAEKARRRLGPERFFDVHMNQLQSDPIMTVDAIYRYFGIPFSDVSREAMTQHVARDARAGHGRHDYRAADFGISEEAVMAGIGEFAERTASIPTTFA